MQQQTRLLPGITDENEFYWTAGKKGTLAIQRCQSCGYYIHPPAPVCSQCYSFDVKPETVSGEGHVASFTVNYQPWLPGMQVPFVVAIVELVEQEGLRLTTNIVNCEPDDVKIGDPVKVVFEQYDDIWLPLFERVVD